jgi:hypothetical protein
MRRGVILASLGALALCYIGDEIIGTSLASAAVQFGANSASFGTAMARLLGIGLVLAAARPILVGPRTRQEGIVLLVIGFCFAFWQPLANAGLPVLPGVFASAYATPTQLLAWSGAAFAVLGGFSFGWPSVTGPSEDPLNTYREPTYRAALMTLAAVIVGVVLAWLGAIAALNTPPSQGGPGGGQGPEQPQPPPPGQ